MFDREARAAHRRFRQSIAAFLRESSLINALTAPLIYSVAVPFVLADAWITLYQWICFPLYGIARVPRRDYFVLDRHKLAYLNAIEKVNCTYCSYANGTIAYIREIAARTEQYWCPIKHGGRVPCAACALPVVPRIRRRRRLSGRGPGAARRSGATPSARPHPRTTSQVLQAARELSHAVNRSGHGNARRLQVCARSRRHRGDDRRRGPHHLCQRQVLRDLRILARGIDRAGSPDRQLGTPSEAVHPRPVGDDRERARVARRAAEPRQGRAFLLGGHHHRAVSQRRRQTLPVHRDPRRHHRAQGRRATAGGSSGAGTRRADCGDGRARGAQPAGGHQGCRPDTPVHAERPATPRCR